MKFYLIALAALAATVVPAASLAQDANASQPAEEAPQATSETVTGKIILYRQASMMGLAVACPVRFKGQEIVELGRGRFAEWDVPPGTYILTNRTASVQVVVAQGQTSYVRCQIKMGFMSGRADLQIVDEESFKEVRDDLEQKPLTTEIVP